MHDTPRSRGKPTQVNILTKSAAEHQRWKLEAARRGWTMTRLIRVAVNKEIGAWVDEQKAVGQ